MEDRDVETSQRNGYGEATDEIALSQTGPVQLCDINKMHWILA